MQNIRFAGFLGLCVYVAVRLSARMHLLHACAWHTNTYGRTAARIFAVANVASRAVELGQQSWGYSSDDVFRVVVMLSLFLTRSF